MTTPIKKTLIILLISITITACSEDFVNPYELIEVPDSADTTLVTELDPTSIEGLHAAVFKPTCSNSGCHDGTFEPDFRTIESTYNTLIYQSIIKNDVQGSFEYRVVPGQPDASVLMARLTFDIDGNSGVMPLAVDPDSDWASKKEEYIENIREWINAGAKDLFGNTPSQSSGLPQMQGVAAFSNSWVSRDDNGKGALMVKVANPTLDLYIAIADDDTSPTGLTGNTIKFATTPDGFDNASEKELEVLSTPIQRAGFNGEQVSYHHKITLTPSELGNTRETIFFRVYVQDQENPMVEIPADGGASHIKEYFSMRLL